MKKYSISLFFCLLSAFLQAQVQLTVSGKILNAEVNKEMKSRQPFTDELVMVYSYATKADAEECLKVMEENAKKGTNYNGYKEIDIKEADPRTGYYEIKAYASGWLMVRVGMSSELRSIDNRLHIDFSISGAVKMQEIVVRALNEDPGEIVVVPEASPRFANVYPITLKLPLGANLGKKNARFVYQPFAVDCTTDSIEAFGRPYVIEGEDFRRTQKRRMGFNLTRDTLEQYVDTAFILSKDPFTLSYQDTIMVKHKKRNYAIFGMFMFMDYNNVYYSKTTMINTCRNILLMDFLELNKFSPRKLDFEKYKKVAERKERPVPGSIQVQFLMGKAQPDMTDTLTSKNVSDLITMLKTISEGAVLKTIEIEGVASPEGRYGFNENLARERTNYLMNLITKNLAVRGFAKTIKARVASWTELADTIAIYDSTLAIRLREIISPYRAHDSQSQAVSRSGLLNSAALQPYLRKLRTVNYNCIYIVNRALTPVEIMEKYKKNPNDNFLPYEYWNLFQMITDTTELEELYNRGAEVNKKYENGNAWLLPECLLAASYISRDTFDLNLLSGFIDRTPISKNNLQPKLNYIKRDFYGRETLINPEEIVANHLIMCLKAQDYEDAAYMAAILEKAEPTEDNLNLIAFAKCMRGLYAQDAKAFGRVCKSSAVNGVIMNLMVKKPLYNTYAERALEKMDKETALYWYLKAVINDRKGMNQNSSMSLDLPPAVNDLVQCFKLDKSFVDFSQRDGSIREMTVSEAVEEYKYQLQEEERSKGE